MIISVSTVSFSDYEKALELRRDVIHPVVKSFPGCKFCYFGKAVDGSDECVIIIGWETAIDRENWSKCWAHDILKEKQWPLMDKTLSGKGYELVLD